MEPIKKIINYESIDSLNENLPLNGSLIDRILYIEYITLLAENHVNIIQNHVLLKNGSIIDIKDMGDSEIDIKFILIKNNIVSFIFKDIYRRNDKGQIIARFTNESQLKLIYKWYAMAEFISTRYNIISNSNTLSLECYRAIKDDLTLEDEKKLKVFKSENLKSKGFFSTFSDLKIGDKINSLIPFSSTLRLQSAIDWVDPDAKYTAILKFKINPRNNIIDLPNSTYCTIFNRNINDEYNKIFEIIIEPGYFIITDKYLCRYTIDDYEELYNIIECEFYPKKYDYTIDNYLTI